MSVITVPELDLWQRGGFAHRLIDVRRAAKRAGDGDQIAGSLWLDPALWLDWKDTIPTDRPAIVYCAFGHEISQALAAALRALGVDARHLAGGIAGWRDAGLALQALPEQQP